MLNDWESKYRKHWPHHYRDILDKLQGPLPVVAVEDLAEHEFTGKTPLAILEKTLNPSDTYKITVQDKINKEILLTEDFPEEKVDEAIKRFLLIIGGWGDQPY